MRWLSLSGFVLGIGLIVLLAFWGNGAVVDPLNVQDDVARPAGNLSGATTLGQTFVAHTSRLSAIQVRWIVSDDFSFAPKSRVTLHLRQRVDDLADLAVVSIPLSEIQHNKFSRFDFPPISDSHEKAYYFVIEVAQAEITRGWLSIWASEDDALPDGEMYVNGRATGHDLAFRAFSSPDLFFAFDAFGKSFARAWTGLPFAVLIFLVPGLALLSFRARREISAESLALIGGLSLATLSAAAFILFWLRLPAVWLIVIMGILVFIAFAVIARSGLRDETISASPVEDRVAPRAMTAVLSALALLSLVVSFIQFAELPAPIWVDSYAHAANIKEFLEQGCLPLIQIYHLAYHSIVALLIQLSGMSIPQAMILVGQLIVVQIGLSFFAFGKRLTGSAVVGLVSAICVWFLTPTPMYFVTWGRYPLLLGTAILPIAFIAAMDLTDAPRFDARMFFLAVITLAGLGFAHIRLLAFYVVFVAIYLAWRNLRVRRLGAAMGRVALVAVVGMILGGLWLVTLDSHHPVSQEVSARVAVVMGIDLATALAVLQSHHGVIVGVVAALGLIVALARRTRSALVGVWFAALLAIAALQPYVVNAEILLLPFVVLMGFFPAALFCGELAQALFAKMRWIGLLVGLAASLLGAREMLAIVNPTTILFTRADERAMAWLAANTPKDARILVNSFAWYPTVYVPSDGGGWIPYFTNRAIVFADNTITPDARARWLDAQPITHVYLGRRAGIWRARDFADAPAQYALMYEEGGVRIFRVNRPSRTAHLSGE
jgi:hypothetical protein